MSYSVSISGHIDSDGQGEAKQAEERIATALKGVIAGLPGVTSALGNFQYIGQRNLKEGQ